MSLSGKSPWSYDLLVDPALPGDFPEENRFRTIRSAAEFCKGGTKERPAVIGILPGVYFLGGTEEDPGLIIRRDYLKLLGLSQDARDVVLADNRGEFQGSKKQRSMTVEVRGTGFEAENISFYNYCNEPLVYPRDPSQNRPARSASETQAYVLGVSGAAGVPSDRLYFKNCRFVSWLDTLAIGAKRAWFKDCYIQGTDDFMGASGVFLYEDCVLGCYSGYPIYGAGRGTAGMVLLRCRFVSLRPELAQVPLNLSKEPGSLAVIDCTFPDNAVLGWCKKLPSTRDFYYYNLRYQDGRPAGIPDSERCACALSARQAEGFNPWNLLRGEDGWNPGNCREAYAALGDIPVRVTIFQDEVRHQSDTLVFQKNASPLEVQSWRLAVGSVREEGANFLRTGRDAASFHTQVFPERLSAEASVLAQGPAALQRLSHDKFSVSGDNRGEAAETAIVTASASNGISASVSFSIAPALLPPPVVSAPALAFDGSAFRLSYHLEGMNDGEDASEIIWYRTGKEASGGIPLSASNGTGPRRAYLPSHGDIGSFLTAVIVPKSSRSGFGAPVSVISGEPVGEGQVCRNALESDFCDIVCLDVSGEIPEMPSGCWSVTGKWLYGTGYDGASLNPGLLTQSQFCRLDYRRDGWEGDMSLRLLLDPEKRMGQGFGGPGQYQEVYIKYDPVTRSGYGVRYTRLPEDARSVEFRLYAYDNGTAFPIGEAKLSRAFRTGCELLLETEGDRLLCRARSKADGEEAFVSLSAAVSANSFGGFGIYHTGTVAAGNRTSLRHIRVDYRQRV